MAGGPSPVHGGIDLAGLHDSQGRHLRSQGPLSGDIDLRDDGSPPRLRTTNADAIVVLLDVPNWLDESRPAGNSSRGCRGLSSTHPQTGCRAPGIMWRGLLGGHHRAALGDRGDRPVPPGKLQPEIRAFDDAAVGGLVRAARKFPFARPAERSDKGVLALLNPHAATEQRNNLVSFKREHNTTHTDNAWYQPTRRRE